MNGERNVAYLSKKHEITPPTAVNAQGCYIYDSTGKAYLDGSGGAAVSCLGHGDPDIIAAVQKQAEALSFAHTGFFTSEPRRRIGRNPYTPRARRA